jgi:hypothetical protein
MMKKIKMKDVNGILNEGIIKLELIKNVILDMLNTNDEFLM